NPPFGAEVKKSEKNYLNKYDFGLKEFDWLDIKRKNTTQKRERQSTEILFIEQCHRFLKVGGYLAIVLPDGILTNSSLQYVRDGIEDKFRYIAIVSMPQTAFSATGAGVKSSVMIVKKNSSEQTEYLQNQKLKFQEELKEQFDYYRSVAQWEKEKTDKLKKLDGFENPFPNMTLKELKLTDEYKE